MLTVYIRVRIRDINTFTGNNLFTTARCRLWTLLRQICASLSVCTSIMLVTPLRSRGFSGGWTVSPMGCGLAHELSQPAAYTSRDARLHTTEQRRQVSAGSFENRWRCCYMRLLATCRLPIARLRCCRRRGGCFCSAWRGGQRGGCVSQSPRPLGPVYITSHVCFATCG